MISVELKVVGGKHAGQSIRLDRKKFLIGREQDCQLRPNSELVSRHHCVFTVDDFAVRLRDLGSTNGTTVNGEQIRKETVLQQGDHVVVGSLEFEVAIDEKAGEEQTTQLAQASEETVVAGSDTLSEMTPIQPSDGVVQPVGQTAGPSPEDTQATASANAATPGEIPQVPAADGSSSQHPPTTIFPPTSAGDTTVIAQPVMMPGQMPYQPMMPQQMGYPMYGNYPYPGMPPQQMPMYPGQQYPGQPYPGQQMPQQQMAPAETAPVEEPEASDSDVPAVSLPDPAMTGAKEPAPKPAPDPNAAAGEGAKSPEQSNESADAIIKQYMQRKPGG